MDTGALLTLNGITLRQRVPSGPGPHRLVLMLHGWTGDEDVMWIFASRLPRDAWLVAPRGLHPAPQGGYGWTPRLSHDWPYLEDFRPPVEALLELLTPANFPTADLVDIDLVGFSQGAALGFSLGLLYPDWVRRMAGLSGFVPDGAQAAAAGKPLIGKSAFLAHGTQDATVPVARARDGAALLRSAGAEVFYCEDDVGHKLSAGCFRSLEYYFKDS
ncbi:MAG: alpha/beta hydrolase [Chloroflexota bacterium]